MNRPKPVHLPRNWIFHMTKNVENMTYSKQNRNQIFLGTWLRCTPFLPMSLHLIPSETIWNLNMFSTSGSSFQHLVLEAKAETTTWVRCLACVGCAEHVAVLILCCFPGLVTAAWALVFTKPQQDHIQQRLSQLQFGPRATKFQWIVTKEAPSCVPRNHWCPQCHLWSVGHQYGNKWSPGSAWAKTQN